MPPGWVRVDMHSHTMWSGDSTTTPDEIAAAVVESGIDVLCITDHNAIKGAVELVDRLSCRVIVGEELRTHAGEIIGLFLDERIPVGVQPDEAARAIRAQGGIVYIPHPFDPMRRNLSESALDALIADGLVDAIEVINAKTSLRSLNERAAVDRRGTRPGRRCRQRRPRSRCDRRGLRRDARLRRPRRLPRQAAARSTGRPPLGRASTVVVARAAGHHRRVELPPVPIIHAIILGLVQGLSEFLPISSSGHLLLVPWLFNWHDFDNSAIEKAFDVALHLGTLVAVVGLLPPRSRRLRPRRACGWWYIANGRRLPKAGWHGCWCCRRFPLPSPARLFEKTIDDKLGKPGLIAVSLIVFGVLLGLADRRAGARTLDDFDRDDAVKVGAAQVLALNPGTSRSGITMTAARYLGFTRDAAARASFLMAVPVTAGAVAYKVLKLAKDGVPAGLGTPMIVGIVTAGVVGLGRCVGDAAPDPNAQLHALRDLPLRPRRSGAGDPRRRLALATG